MNRCFPTLAAALATCLALSAPLQVQAQAQQRPMSLKSLRGEVVFGLPPEVALNGQAARLAPGVRIKSPANMLVMSGSLVGQKLTVNYTADTYGLISEVWLLSAEEIAQPWPTTTQEAATWAYDPVAHAWVKP